MPRTTTVESAGSPPLRALTFDMLGLIKGSDSMHPSDSLIHAQSQSSDLQVKKTILECLSSKILVFPESGEDDHNRKWYFDYLEYFRFGFINSRRTCRQAEADSPAPSPSSSPAESLIIQRPPSPPFFPVVPLDLPPVKLGKHR
ncbi:hypothetical protein L1887_18429 [Cichorium endivia]|nr:hypothetical protein L1887_18429 [Cichorium endivia]